MVYKYLMRIDQINLISVMPYEEVISDSVHKKFISDILMWVETTLSMFMVQQ